MIALLLAAVAERPAGSYAAIHGIDWLGLALAIVGILVAHVANNMMNDLADTEVGSDTADYPRALYAPHPILTGLVTKKQLVAAILAANVIDLVIMIVLTVRHGWPIIVYALAGLLLSYAYTAPPLRLKKYGLGELDVLITWGPLMVGGVYYAGLGTVDWKVNLAAVTYALLPTTVLMGKHIDKIPYDEPIGTHTLPVILGERRAKVVTQAMLVALLRRRRHLRDRRGDAVAGAAHAGRDPARAVGHAEGVQPAQAGRGAAGGRRLAAVVGAGRVRTHAAGRRTARARPARRRHHPRGLIALLGARHRTSVVVGDLRDHGGRR